MSSNNNRATGDKFEQKAVKYLKENEYEVIKTNFHYGKHGEIDIIAEKNNVLVFIEVKGRKNDNYGSSIESITNSKRIKFRKSVIGYLQINNIQDKPMRLDFIGFDLVDNEYKITHIENAF